MFSKTRSARRGAIAVALCAILGSAGAAMASPRSTSSSRAEATHRHGPSAACRLGTCSSAPRAEVLVETLVRTGLELALDGRRWRHEGRRDARCDLPFRCGHRTWVAGRTVHRVERVCVAEARVDRIWVEPVYETRYDACGVPYRVCIRAGHHRTVHVPARWEMVRRPHHVPGYWKPCSIAGVHHHRDHRTSDRRGRFGRSGRRHG